MSRDIGRLKVNAKEIITSNWNMLVPWYLMSSYLYYEKDTNILPDEDYDWICKELDSRWDTIKHLHKHLVDRNMLSAGTGYSLRHYPDRVKSAAILLLERS